MYVYWLLFTALPWDEWVISFIIICFSNEETGNPEKRRHSLGFTAQSFHHLVRGSSTKPWQWQLVQAASAPSQACVPPGPHPVFYKLCRCSFTIKSITLLRLWLCVDTRCKHVASSQRPLTPHCFIFKALLFSSLPSSNPWSQHLWRSPSTHFSCPVSHVDCHPNIFTSVPSFSKLNNNIMKFLHYSFSFIHILYSKLCVYCLYSLLRL